MIAIVLHDGNDMKGTERIIGITLEKVRLAFFAVTNPWAPISQLSFLLVYSSVTLDQFSS